METGCNLSVYQCPYCGTIQLSGEPVPYYREVIRATSVSPAMREFRLKQFRDWLNHYQLHNKKIIEKKYYDFGVVDVTNKFETLKNDML